jgi:4-hydroxy-tetrahydrodipicolinate reductase
VEVAYEFTEPASARENVAALVEAGVRVVCGTTGWKPGVALRKQVREKKVGIVVAPNFSVGMNLFYRLARQAARTLGAAGLHQAYVLESHHVGKVDAPSGTARRLAEIVSRADPRRPAVVEGNPEGRLQEGAVHVASLRAGHEPGRHAVGFDGPFDVIELTHRARSRAGFALGAVLAGEWIVGREGVYGFDPVLDGLTRSGGTR